MSDSRVLHAADLDPDPIAQFHAWFAAAGEGGVDHPEAAAVATATPDGRPSSRMVLVKVVDERGFAFFTNYDSRKGSELAANPHAALLFHWEALERQVRVEGAVVTTPREESITYAHSRARASQLSALASQQSRPVADRATLEHRVAELEREHGDATLPVSERWGGVRIVPERIEFWQGGIARLHDRFIYERPAGEGAGTTGAGGAGGAGGWTITRLQP